MIWLAIALCAAVALAPLCLAYVRPGAARGRRDAALALFRAQLAELERDLEMGRIGAPEHAIARLEIERRMLAEAALDERTGALHAAPLALMLALVPIAGVALYLETDPAPGLPAAPLAARLAAQKQAAANAEKLAARLRAKIATLDPHSDLARQGYMLLGNLEDTEGDLAAAEQAWSAALAIKFDPTLAAQVAEARSRIEGKVSAATAALFRQALAAAPPDAPWREAAEQRLAQPPAAAAPLP